MPNLLNGDKLCDSPELKLLRVVSKQLSNYAFHYDGTNIDELIAYIDSLSDTFDFDSLEFTNTTIDEDGLATIDLIIHWDYGDRFDATVSPNSFLVESADETAEQPFSIMGREQFYYAFADFDPNNKYNYDFNFKLA